MDGGAGSFRPQQVSPAMTNLKQAENRLLWLKTEKPAIVTCLGDDRLAKKETVFRLSLWCARRDSKPLNQFRPVDPRLPILGFVHGTGRRFADGEEKGESASQESMTERNLPASMERGREVIGEA